MIKKIRRAISTVRDKSSKPLHIEFNLTDHCNLNCKGCSHYSPLAPAEYVPLDELEASMRHLSEIKNIELIKEVYLIGGETLLYPDLKKAMKMARKYFPHTRISIFTNGLLIHKLDGEFWEICKEEQCVIAITRYPVKFDYEKAEAVCRSRGVEVEVFGDRSMENSFFKLPLDPEKKQNGRISHFRCISFGCITIDGGRIFPCPQSACVGHLNRKFQTSFKWEKGDFIEVKDIRDAKELLKLRNRPVPFCGYCRQVESVKYETSGRRPEEWI